MRGTPHHGLGRGFKVGKEEIAGLLVALERFVRLDVAAELAGDTRRLETIAERLAGLPAVRTRLVGPAVTGRFPRLEVVLDEPALGRRAVEVSRRLLAGDPPVHVSERQVTEGILVIQPEGLREGDELVVATRLRAVLAE
jgi:L-seryl-tRNA(Ser) seleniumtransferase